MKSRLFQSVVCTAVFILALIGGVIYLSSEDPTAGSNEAQLNHATPAQVELPTLREMIGQKLILGFTGDSVDSLGVQAIASQIRESKVGGVVFLGRNFQSKEHVAQMTHYFQNCGSDLIPWIALDQEGGRVQRLGVKLGFESQPSARDVAQNLSPQDASVSFDQLANDSKESGFNMNLAPVVDLDLQQENAGVGAEKRSYGSQAKPVIEYARVFIERQQARGLLPVIKHFPGHGSSVVDPHFGIADITENWSEEELKPFQELTKMSPAPAVMVGHLRHSNMDPEHPASLSRAIIHGLLREKLGFNGIVMCDDIRMHSIAAKYDVNEALLLAIDAGVDAIMLSSESNPDQLIDHVVKAVESGRLDVSVIEDSYRRIHQFKRQLAEFDGK